MLLKFSAALSMTLIATCSFARDYIIYDAKPDGITPVCKANYYPLRDVNEIPKYQENIKLPIGNSSCQNEILSNGNGSFRASAMNGFLTIFEYEGDFFNGKFNGCGKITVGPSGNLFEKEPFYKYLPRVKGVIYAGSNFYAFFKENNVVSVEDSIASCIQTYENEIKSASTVDQINSAIDKYQYYDPKNLLPGIKGNRRIEAATAEYESRWAKALASKKSILDFIELYQGRDPNNYIPLARVELMKILANECVNDFDNAKLDIDFEKAIKTCTAAEKPDFVLKSKLELKKIRLAQYRNDYGNARTSDDYQAFINRYLGQDPDKLIPKAQAKLAKVKAEELAAKKKREAEERVAYEKQKQIEAAACESLYAGKPVSVNVTVPGFLGSKTFRKEAIITGVGRGMASARVVSDGQVVERRCDQIFP